MTVDVDVAPTSFPTATASETRGSRSGHPGVLRRLTRDKLAMAGVVVLVLLILAAVFAPLLAPYDPAALFAGDKFESPSAAHWLGTDHLGRDNLSRIIYGARVAVRVAVQVVAVALALSVPIGLHAGFRGGRFDAIAMRAMDAIHSIPVLVMALALGTAFGHSFNWALFGIALAFTPTLTRLVRGETLAVRHETFIEASMAIGSPPTRIMRRRVLHNVASPLIVQTSVYVGGAILVEAGLSILGVGIQGGEAAWGTMLEEAFQSIHTNAMNMVYPGAAITLTVLAANLLGDGLRDALGLDPGHRYGSRSRMGLTATETARGTSSAAVNEPRPADVTTSNGPVLEVDHLTISVSTEAGPRTLVEDVSFELNRGEVIGLVGESGSGKTVTSLAIMRLLASPPFSITQGQVLLDGRDLMTMAMPAMRRVRGGEISMIFQDPMAALNPSIAIGDQIAETVRLHEHVSKRAAGLRALELLDRVGIPDARSRLRSYPHEFSGGMRQRAMIAMALACSPKVLIADEPTTALDVTIQAQILDLLRDLQRELELSIIFVTHDLGVVADIANRILVMYAGQIVEQADVFDFFTAPAHPYSRALLGALPRLAEPGHALISIPGSVPTGVMPDGCRFHPRCEFAVEACRSGHVPLTPVGPSHARCIRGQELRLLTEASPADDPNRDLGGIGPVASDHLDASMVHR